jgi:hypothetical protein
MLVHPPLRFLKAYVAQGGFLDGAHGIAVCLLSAVYATAKDLHIWELAQQSRENEAGSGR